ncbi:cysteinyl-tRNA synthetase [Alysiella filiformis]|uniref:Cysteinyl-tRNA synthetase n=1 Tax=Alysiella filiformis DSM 16848 TaxID=1120981 RepID=A0A286E8G6_9NEIS|nr:cysteinyl-tRNA synthetase [Alysiella filiformis]QMT32083.1 cysteinyl-tRNA synthetase [Alysiella filiformis]UBQ57007.1 cysteinyl-tRNA synthetase [Alysiella filiformis DSM 16848]SOD67202.1 hypothetical protein SAMN02746062_00836 [Alysiella filiformis DSM 16848]
MTQQISIDEDALRFTFHSGIQAVKYDDWVHYRNQFQNKCCTDNKAVDIIAHNGQITWLCEVKDFRQGRRDPNKPPLEMEIAQKVRDSLAGLVSAQFHANEQTEQQFAKDVLHCQSICVVLHIEQSTGQKQQYHLPDLQDKLRKLLKAIDPHVLVLNKDMPHSKIVWQVAYI